MTSMEEFVQRFRGARFRPHGREYGAVDCWGVVFLYYRDVLGRPVPSYVNGYSDKDVAGNDTLAALIRTNMTGWYQVDHPQPGDVALFRMSGRPVHVALIVDERRALHAEDKLGVFIEKLNSPMWGKRLVGIYRNDG